MSEGHDRLRRLSAALRGAMPKGFRWNFMVIIVDDDGDGDDDGVGECGSSGCALGLASMVLPERQDRPIMTIAEAAAFFDMPEEVADSIFFCADLFYGVTLSEVTPAQVAALIDQWLDTGVLPTMQLRRDSLPFSDGSE